MMEHVIENGVLKKYNARYESTATVPDGVTVIGERAFYGCRMLRRIALPEGLTEIGKEAFRGCEGLSELNLPDSVKVIGGGAFDRTKLYDTVGNWENGILYLGKFLIATKPRLEYTVKAGGGMVTVQINGLKEILDISIEPEIVDPDDVETLQDILVAAVNEAIKRVEDTNTKEMNALTASSGMPNIPGMF